MPKYEFDCEACNVTFERTLKIAEHLTHSCPSCGGEAHRVWDSDSLMFSFQGSQTGATANTGVHSDDYPTADKVVGRDAEARWAQIGDREKVKAEARKQGDTHALIRHNNPNYIDYEPMTNTGRHARRQLANTIFDTMKAKRAEERASRNR